LILFISHDAGRTGAPISLLAILESFKQRESFKFEILLGQGGPLRDRFRAIATTHEVRRGFWGRVLRRLRLTDKAPAVLLPSAMKRKQYRLIYSNTVTNGALMPLLKQYGAPVITHCHEMESWMRKSGDKNFELVRHYTTKFIACSEAVKAALVKRGVTEDHVSLVPEPAVIKQVRSRDREAIRAELGIGPKDFVVCGGGQETWRKGKDLFVQLAILLAQRVGDSNAFQFVWLGAKEGGEESELWLELTAQYGKVRNRIHWVGGVENPHDYLAAGDAFVMLSREDPMPLIAIEAAGCGLPVFCFDCAGGTADWVRQANSGFVAPYLDVSAMAHEILSMRMKPDALRSLGSNGSVYVTREFSTLSVAKKIENVVSSVLEDSTITHK
jgi:glycosyltransferase involved in cell wall biosynthesis